MKEVEKKQTPDISGGIDDGVVTIIDPDYPQTPIGPIGPVGPTCPPILPDELLR